MIKNKFWKLQSNEKLSTKVANTISPSSSPGSLKKTQSITFQSKEEFEEFSLNPSNSKEIKEQLPSKIQNERNNTKSSQYIPLEEMHKRSKERQSDRKNKGLASKMKLKLQEQLKQAKNQLEQKQAEALQLEAEINMFNGLIRERRKHSEDIGNNEQMLKFKENQLNNLVTIHNEIIEGAKRQIIKEKLLKTENEEKLNNLKRKMNDLRSKWRQKQQKLYLMEQLNKQKATLQAYLSDQKTKDRQKVQVLAESMREIIQELIKKNKKAIEEECEWKVKTIRQVQFTVKNVQHFREVLQSKGITSSTYYTYSQLKLIPELKFKINKQSEKIFQILNRSVNPRIMEIIEHFEQPKELLELKVELSKIDQLKVLNQVDLRIKQKEIEDLQLKKRNLQMSFGDKKKNQLK